MKIFIRGKQKKENEFHLLASDEEGQIVLDEVLNYRGIKGNSIDAEFEVLYELLSPNNDYPKYKIYSTSYKYIPEWLEKGRAGIGTHINRFEIETVNYQLKKYKAKVIYEKQN